ncbi:glycine/D-amino acid oxidase, deaminating [Corynebacterium humireducens NBRC 106098 = DSM 45392]|uniref:Glycine/D-amino acid oxidase, deaminating n=1 Tax=Corynebacterium humireducens NBRC 106098 = DSM 45392 TaxID=1223515 RepID=A0A0B5DAU7_9CORY|nr:FAD-dependent oxidoreductase [Corynebacterium humireducens]AJE32829.1 glycine/D-amino acid oxidase, deaminating [Corynebacterium humireducens NBRC 106098 = DSM 45392]
MTTPLWRDVTAEIPLTALPSGLRVDVAVVGAGFTGLHTALLLARAGLRVAVVEARRVGAGASGATTAKATLLQRTRLSDIADRHGRDAAAAYLAANDFGLEWMAGFCRDHDVPVERTRAVTFSTTDDGAEAVRREYATARDLGLPVELIEHPAEEFATHLAVALPDMLQLDPADLLVALGRAVVDAGGSIHDHTRVTGLDSGADGVTVETTAGTLHAGKVVLATASPILDHGRTTMSLAAQRSYLCAYRAPGPLPEGMFISAEEPTISLRTARVDGDEWLLVGGQGHPTGQEADTGARLADLDAWADHHVPGARRTHAWSAQDYHPVSMLPVVEKLSWGGDRVFFAGGYSKWGLAAAPAAAHIVADLVAGREPTLTFGSPSVAATAATTASTLTKAATAAAGHLAGALTGEPTRGPDDSSVLDEGEAATGRAGVRPVGESVVDGRTCRVSLLCTHMGGLLEWNEVEQSWDCPLHGSRFAADGTVLEGPAVKDLPQVE